jgi:glycosyltransferase involved in cell wall biosynthesis
MIGSGPLRPAVESRIADLNITNCFTLIEHTDDIYSVFSLLDVFVLNSWYEGMGLVLLEAMLLSKPTIGTDVAGINEVIVDGQTGLLVPPRNPTALSEAIVSLILEPARREQMGQAGHLRVTSEFSLEKQVLETAALYEKLVQEKRLGDLNTCG